MGEKILIVDDEVETLRLVGLTLQRQGYTTITANNGTQAIEMAHSENPDLIILDIMMPDMDGFEVTRQLRADPNSAGIPILMFSAKAQLDDKVTGYEAGADDYLTKPIHPSELVNHVKTLLSRKKERMATALKRGYTIGVLSARGGLGVSTLTLNLAIGLHQKMDQEIIAAELRPGHGDWKTVANPVNLEGLNNLLCQAPEDINTASVEKELVRSTHGPRLLLSSARIRDIGYLKSVPQVEAVVQQLSRLAAGVVLDIGTILWTNYESLLGLCHEIIVVTAPYQVILEDTRTLMDDLNEIGFGRTSPLTVALVNRQRDDFSTPLSRIEETLHQSVTLVIPPEPELMRQAEEKRVPLMASNPESDIAERYGFLAGMVSERARKYAA